MRLNNNELQNFEKIPNNWAISPLGKILPISYGKGLTKANRDESGKFPVYGSSGQVGVHSTPLTKKPSLILGRKGSVGEVHYSKLPCWPIDTVYFVEEQEGLNLKFFHYLLKGLNLVKLDKSTAVPGLSRDDYNAVEVAVAPFEQQKLIVAEIEKQFSRLDEAVANLKRIKANLKRYKAAVLKAASEGKLTENWRKTHPNVEPASQLLARILAERRAKWKGKGKYKEARTPDIKELPPLPKNWIWTTVDQLTSMVTSGSRGWGDYYSDTGRIFIRAQDIKTDSLNLENVARVGIPTNAEGTRTAVANGDVLITITGANVTKSAFVRLLLEQAYVSQHVALLKPCLAAVSPYLFTWVISPANGRRILERWAYGAGKPGLSLDQVRSLPIALPPLNEQNEIMAEVERRLSIFEELETTVEANLKRAACFRQSILNFSFSAKLLHTIH